MEGQKYIDQTRKYLDYLEEHLNNIARAFEEVSKACDGMAWVGDDKAWYTLKYEVEHHDLSKFSKEEFTQYRGKFYPIEGEINTKLGSAWSNHKSANTHHWESIRCDADYPGVTERDLVHMVIDWTAMGYKFGDTAQEYYESNIMKINLLDSQIVFIYEIFDRLKKKLNS